MHAFIAPDESFMLLDARREDSLGKADIYVSFPGGDGGWTTPVNLGPGVNSEYGETCPSLSPDGKHLFFSRYNEKNEMSQIYWVDAGVIEQARPGAETTTAFFRSSHAELGRQLYPLMQQRIMPLFAFFGLAEIRLPLEVVPEEGPAPDTSTH